jgi:hypothetical protein
MIFVLILWGIPLCLVLRASVRYLQLCSGSSRDPKEVRFAIALLWLTLLLWLAVGALMFVGEGIALPSTLLNTALHFRSQISVGFLFLLNLPIVLGALLLSASKRTSSPDTLPAKKSVTTASLVLLAAWLLLAMNPH